ncbi:hypothetical protein PABG_11022 [Paracoccidioides brasiliensis Pb03]|nr:hypothetical protein PABG_11022 [Paracoccidioides brasiliensis Pb03]
MNAPFRHPDTQAIRQQRGKIVTSSSAVGYMYDLPRSTIVINDDTDAERDAPRSPPMRATENETPYG